MRNTNQLEQEIEFFNIVLDSLTHPFYVIDANDYSIRLANSAAQISRQAGAVTCYALTHNRNKPCEDPESPCVLKMVKATKEPVITEHVHFDKDKVPRTFEVHGYPIFDSKGNVAQIVEYNLDITERKKAENKIRTSIKDKDVLLREIHHRIKNNMSVISSLLTLQARYIEDEKYKKIFKESVDRIKTMSLIHDMLYRSEDVAKFIFSDYIKDLVDKMYISYGLFSRKITLIKDIERITALRVDEAIPCGLIINELVSNSVKHAFPEGKSGEIKVILRMNEENEIEMTVSDNGAGMPEDLDFRNTDTLGLTIVNTLTRQLQGKIELNREKGTEFKISFRRGE